MVIKKIKEKVRLDEIKKIAKEGYGDMVKAVVDVEREIMAVGAEFHSEEAEMLFEDGSKNENMWGINIYPDKSGDERIVFDSLINIKPLVKNNSMGIDNPEIKDKIKKIVNNLIQ